MMFVIIRRGQSLSVLLMKCHMNALLQPTIADYQGCNEEGLERMIRMIQRSFKQEVPVLSYYMQHQAELCIHSLY